MPNRKRQLVVEPLPDGSILIRCQKRGIEIKVARADALALAAVLLELLLGEAIREMEVAE